HNPDTLLPAVVARHRMDDADDLAAVLHHRVRVATTRPPATTGIGRKPTGRIVGLIPTAAGPMTDENRRALHERLQLIETRATKHLNTAPRQHAPWLRGLATPPRDPRRRHTWMLHARTVAAYRDRYQI